MNKLQIFYNHGLSDRPGFTVNQQNQVNPSQIDLDAVNDAGLILAPTRSRIGLRCDKFK